MTENKRFEICGEGSTNLDVTTYIVEYGDGDDDCFELYESKEDSQKVCDKINNILDENEQLKIDLGIAEDNHKLDKEIIDDIHNEFQKVKKENEQLKSTIKEVTELLSDEVDLFSDKATEHDINAYVELKKLDNKDAYYMATATKKAIRMLKELQRNDC